MPTKSAINAKGMLQNGQDVYYEGRNYPASLYLEQHEQQVCALIGGDNDTPALLQAACDGVQVLVHEATYTQEVADKVGALPMHSSAKQTAEFAYQAAIPNLVLTHFSARYSDAQAIAPLLAEAKLHYHGQVHLAEDFAQYRLLPSGEFQPLSASDA